jgi:hypothetical protein
MSDVIDGGCAVCGSCETNRTRMSRVVIQGRSLELCQAHAAMVVAAMPKTFEDLLALFADVIPSAPRSTKERRAALDRREFPPRPEGRRMGFGRRSADAVE